jgi:hypothetical protein
VPSIEEIRDALQAANDKDGSGPYEAICPFFAEQVNCIHEPLIPFDGVWDRDVLAAWLPIEREVMNKVMTGRTHKATFTIENGNQIAMDGVLSGVMPDGTAVSRETRTVWTIENGQIVEQLDDGTGFDKLENPLATMLGGLDIKFSELAKENGITLPDFYAKAVAAAGM